MQIPATGFRVCVALLAAAATTRADLHFDKTRVELQPKPDEEKVEAVFEFENRGKTAAKILSVTSGCQCLEAAGPVAAIAPGAKDKITGVFKNTGTPGTVEKTLQVRVSEDGEVRNVNLTVAVKTIEFIRIEPRTVTWTAGSDAGEKTFAVKMSGGEPIRLLEVSSSRPGFDVRLETVTEGEEYRVHVKPESGDEPALGVFRFKTDCKYPRLASPIAFGHVRK